MSDGVHTMTLYGIGDTPNVDLVADINNRIYIPAGRYYMSSAITCSSMEPAKTPVKAFIDSQEVHYLAKYLIN
jgi:hypothetical protein